MRTVNIQELKHSNITGIYKIDFPNQKSYIGQSQNIYKRIIEHNNYAKYGHGTHPIQLCEYAIKKYGEVQNITILEENIPIDQLDIKESYWIQYYDTTNRDKGYNLTLGGDVSNKRGCEHPNALFSKEEINKIYDLIINHTELSYKDIAKLYNVNQETIRRIATGISYKNNLLTYPLRTNNHDCNKKNDILDYFSSEQQLIELKEDLLYRWDLSIEFDLQKKYNLPIELLNIDEFALTNAGFIHMKLSIDNEKYLSQQNDCLYISNL